ncbi:MAG TPA: 1-phosphofructokinase family hexose kinase [Flavisolibacter sp.]
MPKILTVTFNPAIDKSTTIKALAPEKKLRCTQPKFEAGGGGLNVARAITRLGGDATALFPAGGYSGKFLVELMKRERVPVVTVETQHHTRENLIVLDTSSNNQYRFGMPGSEILQAEWEQLLDTIRGFGADFIVASGSLSPGIPDDIFGHIAGIAKSQHARLVVDTSGEALKKAADVGVYMLKPNLGELSSLVGKEEVTHEEVNGIAREIISGGGAEVIVVSMGGSGARLVTKDEVHHVTPPVVKRQSTVGAGDSMVAGMVLSVAKGWDMKKVLQYGVAAGTAATMNPGTELCRPEDTERLFRIIQA